ncbi:MAG: hypothetical protein ABIP55_02255, partial [Tepidisphaeraceae bacterium]
MISVPLPQQRVSEDAALIFSAAAGNAISISDADAGILPVTVTLVSGGTLTLARTDGLIFLVGDGASDGAMTIVGALGDINAALDGLIFLPPDNPTATTTLTIITTDVGGVLQGADVTETINISVAATNDAPVNTFPAALQNTSEHTPLTLSTASGNRIAVLDYDIGVGKLRVTLAASGGTVTLAQLVGLTMLSGDGTGDGVVSFEATPSWANAALDGLVFTPTPDYAGVASIRVVTSDLGSTGVGGAKTDDDIIAINISPVNDAPVLAVSGAALAYVEGDGAASIDPALGLSDADNATFAGATVRIVGHVAGQDVLGFVDRLGIAGSFDATSGVLTLSGTATIADYQAALRSVTYENLRSNPAETSRAIRFTVSDGFATVFGDRPVTVS